MTDLNIPRCPSCHGDGKVFMSRLLVDGGHDHGMFDCFVCKGSGKISPEHVERIAKGKQVMAARRDAGVSLSEAAKRFNLSTSALSGVEHGRIDPSLISPPMTYENFSYD